MAIKVLAAREETRIPWDRYFYQKGSERYYPNDDYMFRDSQNAIAADIPWLEPQHNEKAPTKKQKDEKAIASSIAKWEKIAYGEGVDHGGGNCALCAIYFKNPDPCRSCPIQKTSPLFSYCSNTPYEEWCKHHREYHGNEVLPIWVECEKCLILAEKEIEFLESILSESQKELSK